MRTTNRFITAVIILLLAMPVSSFAQDGTPSDRPMYVTVTTMHWNMDNDDFDMDEWIATEKEFMDKVTRKNEHVMGAGFYTHLYTADNREILFVRTFKSWEDIELATARSNELAKEAWPDEKAADAFFKKQASYYSNYHADEIYATMNGAKIMTAAPTKDMVLYIRKSKFAFPEDGSQEEFNKLRDDFTKNVLHKNEYIKGYYPSVHAWGTDRRDFVEAFVVDSMVELDKVAGRTGELVQAFWPDAAKRAEMNKKLGKYFTGQHGDYIYTNVHQLNK
ncbi:MAG: hypothetical protein K8F54_13790 [Altibacter sp.]|uniref:hypothetical protein n=1 Tax=Altibacter sp. TaxID=2024823 RepID=UPI001E0C6536|nr:hypothetical protein [Altibacter sp.]MBZ0328674.1 hypothetical protein [Altibacter sp.]